MKNLRIIGLILLLSALTIFVFADEPVQTTYQYTNPDITIIFSEPLNVTAERQQSIANNIAGATTNYIVSPGIADPDNIICTLFGHDLSTTTVTATHHKVEKFSPRCIVDLYHVTACSRCNYTDAELISSFHIVCCPED